MFEHDQLSWLGKIPELAGGSIFYGPMGEREAIKGFITEHDAVKWIAEYSKAWQRITHDQPSETP
jgi:hypothetical protein